MTTRAGFCALLTAASLAACEPSITDEPQSIAYAPQSGIALSVSEKMAAAEFSGVVLVATKGDVVLRQAYTDQNLIDDTPITPDTAFALASLTKPFTAMLVLQLSEQGLLSLDDTVAQRVPGYTAPYGDQVTIRQLLQNRSGIPHTVDIVGWFDPDFKRSQTPDLFLETISNLPLKFEPGSDYLYSNVNFYLLGLIVESVTGQSYEAALQQRILEPAGMTHTGQIYEDGALDRLAQNYLRDDEGVLEPIPLTNPRLFLAAASLYSTADDLLRWGEMIEGTTLLTEDSKAIMFAPQAPMGWVVGQLPVDQDTTTAIRTYNGELAGYTSMFTQLPEFDYTIILLNNNNAGYDFLSTMTIDIAAQLMEQESGLDD